MSYSSQLFLAAIILVGFAAAQQDYNEPDGLGYRCSARRLECSTQVVYRAKEGQQLAEIAALFNVSAQAILVLNSSPGEEFLLQENKPLLVPIVCSCSASSNRSSADLQHRVNQGMTYYIAANEDFEGLATSQAMEAANPGKPPGNLEAGEMILVPLRCACSEDGKLMLVTYPLTSSEDTSLSVLSKEMGIEEGDLIRVNRLQATFTLVEHTTLLVPVKKGSKLQLPAGKLPPPKQDDDQDGGSSSSSPERMKASNWGVYVGAGSAALSVVMVTFVVVTILLMRRKRCSLETSKEVSKPAAAAAAGKHGSRGSSKGGSWGGMTGLEYEKLIWYPLEEIQEATNDFDEACKIEGSVYAASLRGTKVAIKRMQRLQERCSSSGTRKEVNILSRVHHASLVSFLGASLDEKLPDQIFVVYEFAANGSLSSWIHSGRSKVLSWRMRLLVAVDVAIGLEYLHDYIKPNLVHKNITSGNILLDASFRGKIANFRMAMDAAPASSFEELCTKHIVGTQGYLAPEYLNNGTVSSSMDVFAFGVVLLELLTGLEPMFKDAVGKWTLLVEGVLSSTETMASVIRWVDPAIRNECGEEKAAAFAQLAKACVREEPELRPTMKNVAFSLSKLLG